MYLTEERQQIALELLTSGFNYNVEIIDDEKELIECYEITKYRNTSAKRFNLLVGNHISKVDTVSFYKVMARSTDGTVDLVAVFSNGSFACTDPYFPNHGLPSSQIMSAFTAGYISISVLFHFHPLYLQPFSEEINSFIAKQLSVAIHHNKVIFCTEISEKASWNYAVCNRKGMEINRFRWPKDETIVHPHINSFRVHSDSIAEMCKKELQKLLPIIVHDEAFRAMFFKVVEDIKTKHAKDAQSNVQARQNALGYNQNSISVSDISSSVTSYRSVLPIVLGDSLLISVLVWRCK